MSGYSQNTLDTEATHALEPVWSSNMRVGMNVRRSRYTLAQSIVLRMRPLSSPRRSSEDLVCEWLVPHKSPTSSQD